MMKQDGSLMKAGEEILEAACKAGCDLIHHGALNPEDLELIRRPLISEEEHRQRYNALLQELAHP